MHNTYTSGAARRNAIDAAQITYTIMAATMPAEAIADVNADHKEAGRINPILDYFRDDTYHGDPDLHYYASEYLFQLARHWSEWQSPRIGTFPHEYRDPTGPATREESEESGEDRAYWYIADALASAPLVRNYGDRTQDYIVHATAVIGRLYTMSGGDAE